MDYWEIYTHYGTFATETKSFVSPALADKLLPIYPGNIVIACTSENVEDVGKAVAWLGNKNIVTGGHSVVFRHNQNPKYIAYYFQTQCFNAQKKKYAYGAKVIDIRTDDLAKIRIPIPPLELQKKIVAILDRFETLVNDLTQGLPAEIAAIKEQYEYYRNKLLTFKPLRAWMNWFRILATIRICLHIRKVMWFTKSHIFSAIGFWLAATVQ